MDDDITIKKGEMRLLLKFKYKECRWFTEVCRESSNRNVLYGLYGKRLYIIQKYHVI